EAFRSSSQESRAKQNAICKHLRKLLPLAAKITLHQCRNKRISPWGLRSGTTKRHASPAALARASAVRYPARTAPSMVEGQPVAVQSPLRKRRGQGVDGDKRKPSLSGAGAKVACTSLTT